MMRSIIVLGILVLVSCKTESKEEKDNPEPVPAPTTTPAPVVEPPKPVAPVSDSEKSGGTESEDTQAAKLTPPEGFLRSSSLRPPRSMATILSTDLASALSDRTEFFWANDLEDEENCLADDINSAKAKATKTELIFEEKVTLRGCKGDRALYEGARLQYLYAFGCEGADFSKFDGKRYSDISEATNGKKEFCPSGKGYVIGNYELEYEYDSARNGIIDASFRLSKTNERGEACTFEVIDDRILIDDGCVDTTIGDYGPVEGTYFQGESRDLVALSGKIGSYEDGLMKIQLNNWTGTVEFRGFDRDPIYELSDGSQDEFGRISLP